MPSTIIAPDPNAIPVHTITALSRTALRCALRDFEDPAFRAEFEEWLAKRNERATET